MSRRRTVALIGGGALALLLLGVAGVVATSAFGGTTTPEAKRLTGTAEATVERGTLSGSVKASGTLSFADPHDVGAGRGGVVTALPAGGARVGLGQSLFSVDNRPVFLFHGAVPAWRGFGSGMDDGPDVKQLEDDLAALGHFSGTPDDHFSSATATAIRAWQKATGQERTGTIDLGAIVFQPGDVRISGTKAQLGDQVGVGAPVVSVTSLTKHVEVSLRLSDQKVAKAGQKVVIALPGGATTAGTVSSVGVPTPQDPKDANSPVIIPTVVTLDDPAAAGDFQQATVVVDFPSDVRENVLSVPVEALLALPGGGYGVEVIRANGSTARVRVTPGLFAGGRVEVSGAGIDEGAKVVVPEG